MSLAFALAHPHWYPLSGGFNPAGMFAGGTQGVFYDTTDITTMFQDSAGTTPVTALEQPVGLMLDKSKGLVLGPELVTNGNFATDTWWSKDAGVTISGGACVFTAVTTNRGVYRTNLTTAGRCYSVTYTITVNSGAIRVFASGANGVSRTTSGTYTELVSGASGNLFGLFANPAFDGSVDNISVREIPGNHWLQATSTKRPTWSARYNLLQRTEEFDNAYWLNNGAGSCVANAAVAPNGTTTADKLVALTGAAQQQWFYKTGIVVNNNTSHTFSAYVKAGGYNFAQLRIFTGSRIAEAGFNLLTGQTYGPVEGSAQSEALANGWWRVSVTAVTSGTSAVIYINVNSTASLSESFTGDGTSGIFVWGADLRRTIDTIGMPAYQRVGNGAAGSADYDSAGFFPYLSFDGVSNSAATAATVDFTATDKLTVFSGVTKLSDAALTIFTELSANFNSNNGSFYISAPELTGASGNFSANLRGSTAPASVITSGTDAAPVTRVVTVTSDIGQALRTMRISGVQTAQSSQSQGTGNFGNYTLFLGARNNASLFFNGRMYPQIILGRAASASEITATEQWLRQRMPVSF